MIVHDPDPGTVRERKGLMSHLLSRLKPLREWRGVRVGMAADDVLDILGKPLRTERAGSDRKGLVVKWVYDDAILTMRRRMKDGVTCYRVAKIHLHRR